MQKAVQSLAKAVYVSCTILNNRRTSIFNHQVALIKENILHFQEDKLLSVDLSALIHPDIDRVSRPIEKIDLLADIFFKVCILCTAAFREGAAFGFETGDWA